MSITIPGGFLAVIEGIDGAGKSSLLPVLAAMAERAGLKCIISREPTTGKWGQALRESARTGRLPLEEEIEYFLRDREEHVQTVIRPALEAGQVVLLDRYYFSTAAYQGARGADPVEIIRRNEAIAPAPDLVLLLDLEVEAALARVRRRGEAPDEFERKEALAAVRKIFLSIKAPSLVLIDASLPPDVVASRCEEVFELALKGKLAAAGDAC